MSRGQDYYRKLYGRAGAEERDIGRIAEMEYSDDNLVYINFRNCPGMIMLKHQYSALEQFCQYFDQTPDQMIGLVKQEYGFNAFSTRDEHVNKISTPTVYLEKVRGLKMPHQFTDLVSLFFGPNQISSLQIPHTLAKLKLLSISNNPISELIIPKVVPLETLYCEDTNLPEQTKQELRERGVQVIDR